MSSAASASGSPSPSDSGDEKNPLRDRATGKRHGMMPRVDEEDSPDEDEPDTLPDSNLTGVGGDDELVDPIATLPSGQAEDEALQSPSGNTSPPPAFTQPPEVHLEPLLVE